MISYNELRQLYKQYVPHEKEGVFILSLYQKILNGEISEYFTYEEIRDVLLETHGTESTHVQDFMRNLLTHFIERPHRRNEGKYRLTEYAKSFAQLIFEQVNNLREKYSLHDTFSKFAHLNLEVIDSYLKLDSWFQQSFNDLARKTINDHINGLNNQLKESLEQLNNILRDDGRTLGVKIVLFSQLFQLVSDKALDIQQTLQFRYSLYEQLDSLVEKIHKQTLLSQLEQKEELSIDDYKNTKLISSKVRLYFREVEERLDSIIDKIRFAEEKLTDLQSNLSLYANRRINIKKLLGYYLDNAQFDKAEGIKFRVELPTKCVVCESIRFIEVEKYEFGVHAPRERVTPQEDPPYFEKEKKLIDNQLENQTIETHWIERVCLDLEENYLVDLSKYFWLILNNTSNIEIATKVCFTILNRTSTNKSYIIDIKKEIETSPDNSIKIWKMKIFRNNVESMNS